MTKDDTNLRRPLSVDSKINIRREIFGFDVSPVKSAIDAAFLGTLDTELRNFTSACLSNQRSNIEMETMVVEDLLTILKSLRHERAATRRQIRSQLQSHVLVKRESCLDLGIDLAACLLTMLGTHNSSCRHHRYQRFNGMKTFHLKL